MEPSKPVSELSPEDLPGKIGLLQEQISRLLEANALQAEEIRLLRAIIFGRKSEKRSHTEESSAQQLLLFEDSEKKAEAVSGKDEKVEVKSHSRKKSGRRPIPAHLPRVEKNPRSVGRREDLFLLRDQDGKNRRGSLRAN